jgi:hypothetical protein
MGSLMICTPDKIEKEEMSEACSSVRGEERGGQGFGEET